MDKRNDFEFCMLVHDLAEAAAGKDVDKESLLARLSDIEITNKGESAGYLLLSVMKKLDGEAFAAMCKMVLLYITHYISNPTETYNPLNAATHELLVLKRQELARLENEVEEMEAFEHYRELKELLGPDGKIGDSSLDREYEELDRRFNPEKDKEEDEDL